MSVVTIHVAKTHLSQLLARVEAGRRSFWRADANRSPGWCRIAHARPSDSSEHCETSSRLAPSSSSHCRKTNWPAGSDRPEPSARYPRLPLVDRRQHCSIVDCTRGHCRRGQRSFHQRRVRLGDRNEVPHWQAARRSAIAADLAAVLEHTGLRPTADFVRPRPVGRRAAWSAARPVRPAADCPGHARRHGAGFERGRLQCLWRSPPLVTLQYITSPPFGDSVAPT